MAGQSQEESDADVGDFYNVVAILQEKKNTYLVQWEGTDPATGKDWDPSWVKKSDCTDDLIREWNAKKPKKKSANGQKGSKRGASVVEPTKKGKRSSSVADTPAKPANSKRTSVANGNTPAFRTRSKPTNSDASPEREPEPTRKRKRVDAVDVAEEEIVISPRKKRRLGTPDPDAPAVPVQQPAAVIPKPKPGPATRVGKRLNATAGPPKAKEPPRSPQRRVEVVVPRSPVSRLAQRRRGDDNSEAEPKGSNPAPPAQKKRVSSPSPDSTRRKASKSSRFHDEEEEEEEEDELPEPEGPFRSSSPPHSPNLFSLSKAKVTPPDKGSTSIGTIVPDSQSQGISLPISITATSRTSHRHGPTSRTQPPPAKILRSIPIVPPTAFQSTVDPSQIEMFSSPEKESRLKKPTKAVKSSLKPALVRSSSPGSSPPMSSAPATKRVRMLDSEPDGVEPPLVTSGWTGGRLNLQSRDDKTIEAEEEEEPPSQQTQPIPRTTTSTWGRGSFQLDHSQDENATSPRSRASSHSQTPTQNEQAASPRKPRAGQRTSTPQESSSRGTSSRSESTSTTANLAKSPNARTTTVATHQTDLPRGAVRSPREQGPNSPPGLRQEESLLAKAGDEWVDWDGGVGADLGDAPRRPRRSEGDPDLSFNERAGVEAALLDGDDNPVQSDLPVAEVPPVHPISGSPAISPKSDPVVPTVDDPKDLASLRNDLSQHRRMSAALDARISRLIDVTTSRRRDSRSKSTTPPTIDNTSEVDGLRSRLLDMESSHEREIATLQSEIARIEHSKAQLQRETEFLTEVYRTASKAASELSQKNDQLEKDAESARTQAAHGVKQCELTWSTRVASAEAEAKRLQEQLTLAQETIEHGATRLRDLGEAEERNRALQAEINSFAQERERLSRSRAILQDDLDLFTEMLQATREAASKDEQELKETKESMSQLLAELEALRLESQKKLEEAASLQETVEKGKTETDLSLVDLRRTVEELEYSKLVLQNDLDAINEIYRSVSGRASDLAKENTELTDRNLILQRQATTGIQQCHLHYQVTVDHLKGELARWQGQATLFEQQAKLTESAEVRRRAAIQPLLEQEVEDLRASNADLEYSLELSEAEIKEWRAKHELLVAEMDQMRALQAKGTSTKSTYMCLWRINADDDIRCKAHYNSREELDKHFVQVHALAV